MEKEKKEIVKEAVGKVAMIDAGVKHKGFDVCAPLRSETKDKKYYPSLYLSDKEAPMLKDCSAGDIKKMVIEVKVTSVSSRDSEHDGKRSDYSLEIRKIGLMGE